VNRSSLDLVSYTQTCSGCTDVCVSSMEEEEEEEEEEEKKKKKKKKKKKT
jgi:hypothetical protein